jgi:hypothetical protein
VSSDRGTVPCSGPVDTGSSAFADDDNQETSTWRLQQMPEFGALALAVVMPAKAGIQ